MKTLAGTYYRSTVYGLRFRVNDKDEKQNILFELKYERSNSKYCQCSY